MSNLGFPEHCGVYLILLNLNLLFINVKVRVEVEVTFLATNGIKQGLDIFSNQLYGKREVVKLDQS